MTNFSGKFRVTTICVDESTGEVIYHHQESCDHRPDFRNLSVDGEIQIPETEDQESEVDYNNYPILYGEDFEHAYAEYEENMGWEPGMYDDTGCRRDDEHVHRSNEYCALEYGEFLWIKLPVNGLLLPDKDPADLARAFFIGSNMTNAAYSPVDLGLTRSKSTGIRNILKTGLFTGSVYPENFDRSIMWRGKIGKEVLKSVSKGEARVQRLYIDQYKSTYQNVPVTKHAYLGRLIKLLPYVHQFYGVFCQPEDVNTANNVRPLSFGDLASIVGIGRNHSSRLRDNLLGLTFTRKGRSSPVIYESVLGGDKVIVLNPKFMYGGSMVDRDDLMVPVM